MKLKLALGAGCALAVLAAATATQAEERTFNLVSSRATDSIPEFARQAGLQIVAPAEKLRGVSTPAIEGRYDTREALAMLIAGTGLEIASDDGRTIMLAQSPQAGSANDGADGTVEALVVTAQKREEDIQDVPIAISAFTQEDLTRQQIAGGPDLMTQVPNFTFTKTNFSSYSIQIRGIGTQAISATTDPAVAVAFNNAATIQNRFFEQEFYDMQRVEVLRGPQGTLYGRNATAGVVNLITQKPRYDFEARASADVANYGSTRLEGMINLPLVEDRLALRLAGAWTKRDGYVTNEVTGNQIDGRDIWSTRLSLRFDPTERIRANFIWEHFEEDDDRLRSGKQLCKKDTFPTDIGGVPVPQPNQGGASSGGGGNGALQVLTYLSQGCEAASLYSEESFQTPNGYALPYYGPLGTIGFPTHVGFDVYLNSTQSRDLRVIESSYEPSYKARADVAYLSVDFDLADSLTLTSETYYSADALFSTQDFNRFTTRPGAFNTEAGFADIFINRGILSEDGIFCDPQLGCSDRLTLGDLSTHEATQFGQEFRLSSDFDGPFNFNLGTNFVRYDTVNKYYVFVNSLTMFALLHSSENYVPGVSDATDCLDSLLPGDPFGVYNLNQCIAIDPNPIGSLNDRGHNYFLSKNPYRLISYAIFGEAYYNITPDLKLTAGLRYTVDKKHAPRIPSWLLAGQSIGHPVAEVVEEEWREPTGRITLDWKPNLAFADETLLYALYAHGYKAGGMNPPTFAFATYNGSGNGELMRERLFFEHPPMFQPEFIDAYELGSKNTLLDGRLTLNGSLFYYDYQGYQISEIVNRSALNRNFDAEVWGGELEADWRPLENLKFGLKLGFEKTRVGDGQAVIDLMDRTAGDPNYFVIKPLPTIASNCIVPVSYVQQNSIEYIGISTCTQLYYGDFPDLVAPDGTINGLDPSTVPNMGAGIAKDISGNELPNAPDMTATLTVDYTVPLPSDWLMTLHADLYRQSEAWTRIINSDPYDRLQPFEQVNFAAIFSNDDAGWNVMAYVKNVLDSDNITGAFLNSDDTGLTTNVFLNEPRLYGLRVTKAWTGEPWWSVTPGQVGRRHPLTVELGGMTTQVDAPNEVFRPAWVDEFTSPTLAFPIGTQEEDLDWGDEREVKIAFRPQAGPWQVAARARFGRTNGVAETWRYEFTQGPYNDKYQATNPGLRLDDGRSGGLSETHDQEKHTLVDFQVGRDLGLGLFGEDERSTVSLGLRYAQFETTSRTSLVGIPEYVFPTGYVDSFSPVIWNEYDSRFSRTGEFRGTGPMVSWEASKRLFQIGDFGRANLDWSLTGGMLFGKQETSLEGDTRARYFAVGEFFRALDSFGPTTVNETQLEPRTATRDVEVPFFGASLGLSYEIDRFKVGAGYSWERFSDVFDGGIAEARDVDRTIQGPYFRLSVGFGGG